MELERVIAALAPRTVVARAPIEVRDLAYAAGTVESGALFFCVPGARADGHDFAADAVTRGAVALVVERPLDLPVPQLVVDDARAAMAVAADVFFDEPTRELQVAGVTGTNGKTTTAFLLYAILASAGRRPGLLGTIESRVGGERRAVVRTTPEAIDLQRTFREMLDAGDRSCAMEASSHAAELRRLDRVHFSCLVFTNLSQDHLDFHGTMARYFDAKRELFLGDGPLRGRIARSPADLTIVTSDNPRSEDPKAIIEEIVARTTGDVDVDPDRGRAIARAIEGAREGDVVVIAGKGHEQGQELAD